MRRNQYFPMVRRHLSLSREEWKMPHTQPKKYAKNVQNFEVYHHKASIHLSFPFLHIFLLFLYFCFSIFSFVTHIARTFVSEYAKNKIKNYTHKHISAQVNHNIWTKNADFSHYLSIFHNSFNSFALCSLLNLITYIFLLI